VVLLKSYGEHVGSACYALDMEEVLQANIFFFITGVAVILATPFVVGILYYLMIIMKNLRDVSEKLKSGSDVIMEDYQSLRERVKSEGSILKRVFTLVQSVVMSRMFGDRDERRSGRRKEGRDDTWQDEEYTEY
jgi:hypothetical protein